MKNEPHLNSLKVKIGFCNKIADEKIWISMNFIWPDDNYIVKICLVAYQFSIHSLYNTFLNVIQKIYSAILKLHEKRCRIYQSWHFISNYQINLDILAVQAVSI